MNLLSHLIDWIAPRPARRARRSHSFGTMDLESRTLLAAAVSSPLGNVAYIVNGTNTTGYPSVCLVGDASDYFGSGTLIAPQYVLTAGHVAEGVSDTGGRVSIGGQTYSTTKVTMHPSYNGNQIGSDSANDIAIYKLDRPVVGVTPSPIFRAAPTVGQMLTLVGFGGGGTGTTGTNGDFGIKRVGTTPIDQVSTKLIHWSFDNNTESNTAPGDSGGPAFVTVGGVQYVAGVTSGGDQANAGIGDHSFDTRVDAYATWIDSIVGTTTGGTLPTISISATDASAAETATGQTANGGTFVVTRTGSTTGALTVNLAISGSATNGTDYNSIPTTVTIPAGATSATISLTVRDDSLQEGTETATLKLGTSAAYTVSTTTNTATVSIADNEVVTSNDKFANRKLITGKTATVTGTNVGATKETGEPTIAGVGGGKSVWWTWTAPSSGAVTITTAGSSFDTALGVYRGSSVNALTQVAANDDENATARLYTSKVSFNAVAGQVYQIAVDGYRGATGSIKMSLNLTSTTTAAVTPTRSLFDSIFAKKK